MADFAYVSSLDGKPKKWMADSLWYELGEKERKLFPFHIADQAREFYTVAFSDGQRADPTVLVEPFEGDVAPAPVQEQKYCDEETGLEYETLAELIAAVKKRAAAPPPEKAEQAAEQPAPPVAASPQQNKGFLGMKR